MFLEFDSHEVAAIVGVRSAAAFFANLPKLLPATHEWIIGIGCYEPEEAFETWCETLGEVSVPRKFDFQRAFDLNRKSYPRGRGFYLRAAPSNIDRLARFVTQSQSPDLFCDHVIAFEGNLPLFSFHDAFQGSDLLVSPRIPQVNVQAFCDALAVTFHKIKPPAFGEGFDEGIGIDPISD